MNALWCPTRTNLEPSDPAPRAARRAAAGITMLSQPREQPTMREKLGKAKSCEQIDWEDFEACEF